MKHKHLMLKLFIRGLRYTEENKVVKGIKYITPEKCKSQFVKSFNICILFQCASLVKSIKLQPLQQ